MTTPITCLFSGQGYDYLQDLERLCATKNPLVKRLLQSVHESLAQELTKYEQLAADDRSTWQYRHGLDFASWCASPEDEQPPQWYLASAPVSYPLIFLTQMANYTNGLDQVFKMNQSCFVGDQPQGDKSAAESTQDSAESTTSESKEPVTTPTPTTIASTPTTIAPTPTTIAPTPTTALQLPALHSAIGHSQGVVSAIVVSMSRTDEQLVANTATFAKLMFWLGMRCHETLNFRLPKKSSDQLFLSPMLAVEGLTKDQLQRCVLQTEREVQAADKALSMQLEKEHRRSSRRGTADPVRARPEQPTDEHANSKLHISLLNGPTSIVVSGQPRVLSILATNIDKMSVKPGEEHTQRKLPFSSRKPVATTSFLKVSAPFHCPMNSGAVEKALQDVKTIPKLAAYSVRDLRVPVYTTFDGSNFQDRADSGLVADLVRMQALEPVDFVRMLASVGGCDYILEYGPVGQSTIGATARMAGKLKQGSGIQVAAVRPTNPRQDASEETQFAFPSTLPKLHVLYHPNAQNWKASFGPTLVKRKIDGKCFVSTKFSRFVGKPPVVMSGMTPTTSYLGIDLVAACGNAGFHGELAAGGLPTPSHFVEKLNELQAKQTPGVGINVNMLYLNAYQWGFQFPLILKLAKEGCPIESITIGAGIPTPGKADEIVTSLQQVGIRYMALKPGSAEGIRQVLEIAQQHPKFTFMLQWTGGRGGGHHSGEDFHAPLLDTYGEVRQHDNVILVCGSGFGDDRGTLPYLDGSWARTFGRPDMPIDAVLFGSRCMVAKEAATSIEVKRMIVHQCNGTKNELEWEHTYKGGCGGIISVTSELGEQIHKIHNKAMQCWREFDSKYFSLPRGSPQREAAILADKAHIIQSLNDKFQKVFFGLKSDGTTVADLDEMTYAETLHRMVDLMYVENGGDGSAGRLAKDRWIDRGYLRRTFLMVQRVERRFMRDVQERVVADEAVLASKPKEMLGDFLRLFPEANTTLMADEDVSFFVQLCKNLTHGKPVNFVPEINNDLEFWFKKDSLWFSEQLDCVPNRDPERVCVLHGPVAASYSTIVNEPIASILGNVHQGHVGILSSRSQHPEVVESLLLGGPGHASATSPSATTTTTTRLNKLSTIEAVLACPGSEWLKTVFACHRVVQQRSWVENPIPRSLKERDAHHYEIERTMDGATVSLVRQVKSGTNEVVVQVQRVGDGKIVLTLFDLHPAGDEPTGAGHPVMDQLDITFQYSPTSSFSCLFQTTDDSMEHAVKEYYARIWLDSPSATTCGVTVPKFSVQDHFESEFVVTVQHVQAFNQAIGRDDDFHLDNRDKSVPTLDFATVVGWKPLVKALFAEEVGGNLLNLVHMSHKFTRSDADRTELVAGEVVKTSGSVAAIEVLPGSGKKVTVTAKLHRAATSGDYEVVTDPWVTITSSFLIRGDFSFSETNFRRTSEDIHVKVEDDSMAHTLNNQDWIDFTSQVAPGDNLQFCINIFESRNSESEFDIVECEGTVFKRTTVDSLPEFVAVGTVSYCDGGEGITANVVMAYLESVQTVSNKGTMFENGGYTLLDVPYVQRAPEDCAEYACASGDLNPIHRNKYFAEFVELPGDSPIVHGMWTSAMARGVLEDHLLSEDGEIEEFGVDFLGMVFPGDELATQLKHVGLVNGKRILELEVCSLTHGDVVLRGRARVSQPNTAYLFTGQGSAVVGMGMDRYEKSPIAKGVWDRADVYFKQTYGFSIVDIVKNNPTQLTIHFGGPLGKRIREKYIAMKTQDPNTGEEQQLIQEIRWNTKSFTFKSPDGLLFATQFSQPALVLVQKAAFEELREGGFVPLNSMFAGHSLGEYAALASFADVLSIEALVETVFLRGMVMQNAVHRDANGRSNYGMVAANPIRVSKQFNHHILTQVVELIEQLSGGQLIQIVNYNVRNMQYVIAGELETLDALSHVLTAIKGKMATPDAARITDLLANQLSDMVKHALGRSKKRKNVYAQAGLPFALERGSATIPLPGIDVPFHSKQLLKGVGAFRKLLQPRLALEAVAEKLHLLVDKYIPNVVAEPFSVQRDFVKQVLEFTGSNAVSSLLNAPNFDAIHPAVKARTLLIELLAHQFAMPVQWIDTQDVMFIGKAQRIIEMGPAPTLTNMAKQTYKMNVYDKDDSYAPDILWWGNNQDEIVYDVEGRGPTAKEFVEARRATSQDNDEEADVQPGAEEDNPSNATVVAATPPLASRPPLPPTSSSSAGGTIIEDKPPAALHALKVILSNKLQVPIASIKDDTTIKALSNGRSAIQNELVGDLGNEFGASGLPEGAAETPLDALAQKFPGYAQLGKQTSTAISKMLSGKMPGGFAGAAVRAFLVEDMSLTKGTCDSVLLHGLTMLPPNRLESVDHAKAWLESVVTAFASHAGVALTQPQQTAAQSAGGAMFMQQAAQAATPVPDAPVESTHALKCLLVSKLRKRSLDDVKDTDTIKGLTGGRSAVQNEVVGDLLSEFKPANGNGDGVADLQITALGESLGGSYSSMGPVTQASVNKMLAQKLPGGFSTMTNVKAYLSETRLLGPGRSDSVLLHALTMAPDARFADESTAKAWVDNVVDAYGKYAGVAIPHTAKGGGVAQVGLGGGGGPVSEEIVQRAMKKHRESLGKFFQLSLGACSEYLEEENLFDGGKEGLVDQSDLDAEKQLHLKTERLLDGLYQELGEPFCEGVQPQHDNRKVRVYDSCWNWVIQDALELHNHVLAKVHVAMGKPDIVIPNAENLHYKNMASWIISPEEMIKDGEPPRAWFRNFLSNRATPDLLKAVKYMAKANYKVGHGEYAQAITLLAEQIEEWVDKVPIFSGASMCTDRPSVHIAEDGSIKYDEVEREDCRDPSLYVKAMSRGVYYNEAALSAVANPSQSVLLTSRDEPFDIQNRLMEEDAAGPGNSMYADDVSSMSSDRQFLNVNDDVLPTGSKLDAMRRSVVPRGPDGAPLHVGTESAPGLFESKYDSIHVIKELPHLCLKSPSDVDQTMRVYNPQLTSSYLSCLHDIAMSGVSFAGQNALVLGAGDGSIGIELVKGLLEGGAVVVVGIRIQRDEQQLEKLYGLYRSIYEEFGSKGSKLFLVPCNFTSSLDVTNLVEYVYGELSLDLDFVVPFAAVSENGRDISSIDSRSEAAHRMMLTNVVRLLGAVKKAKEERAIDTRPAMVLLPCSPNHGVFGFDGLYAESKLGCEALLNKWESEGWENYLSLSAAVIGWTRSKLMFQNNIVAPGVEERGCRTFHTTEMAFNLLGLLHPYMTTLAAEAPIWADLTGNWHKIKGIKEQTNKIRSQITEQSKLRKAMLLSDQERRNPGGAPPTREQQRPLCNPLRMCTKFPKMPDPTRDLVFAASREQLAGAVDLRKVVVVTGFGEVGPWGNSKTRWEMEAFGEFSMEGCVQLAWLLGLIVPSNGPLKGNPRKHHIGWVDAQTGEPVEDFNVKERYEAKMLKHCGVRIVEPELFNGYDPKHKKMLHYVAIDSDMRPLEVSNEEEALEIQRELGKENTSVFRSGSGSWYVKVKRGSVLAVPRALTFNRFVAGQIPTGWDAKRLGVPNDIAESVDPVTLYALVATVDAFVSSGIVDPYEMYKYVHLCDVGNTSGSGMGGMRSLDRMFFQRKLEKEIPSDTLAESFINTMPAWINMLLLSSCGPIKTPVGACATAAESVEIAVDTIVSGKARVVVAGGYDDFGETGSFEFAQMGATNNSEEDAARGRFPKEASRPMTASRNGFVEAQGSGIQLLMDAELALEMGTPIYGIVALTNTATDKEGRSIPAPGQGILTTAREVSQGAPSALLDIDFRMRNLREEIADVERWAQKERKLVMAQVDAAVDDDGISLAFQAKMDMIDQVSRKKRSGAYETWGQGFFRNLSNISPLRGALAVWGLTVDDINVGSFHGTSTKLNDKNESDVVNKQMQHLGRSEGNHMLVVAQKYLTGHPKGAACAWMMNGMLQCLNESLVPGNRNLDNVAPELQDFKFLFYPNRSIRLPRVKAALIKSFGFGQAGAEILLVHPDYLLATLSAREFEGYRERRNARENKAYRYEQGVYSGKHTLVQVKTHAPYVEEDQQRVYLDPTARASFDETRQTYMFRPINSNGDHSPGAPNRPLATTTKQNKSSEPPTAVQRLELTVKESVEGLLQTAAKKKGLGVDVEPFATFNPLEEKQAFIQRNFTELEQEYCYGAANPVASFAGRWAAKEAVIKAITSAVPTSRSLWGGGDAPLKSIEIVSTVSGAPKVELHGHAKDVFTTFALSSVVVSISHSNDLAVAQAMVE